MLELKNISLSFAKGTNLQRNVITNLSLKLNKGDFAVIIGGNGAGKSTLFNLISGSYKLDAGQVFLGGKNISKIPCHKRAGLVSKVMQDPKLGTIEEMSILENMTFALKRGKKRGLGFLFNNKRKELYQKKLQTLHMGLENRLNEQVSNLSGGQRQGLSIIMATLAECKILLLDEITAALDPLATQSIMSITNDIIEKEKLTALMITHNLNHAIKYGNRLLIMKNGSFVKEYSAEEKATLTTKELADWLV
jgi:putative ABC transport system ATP-binding protein